MVKHIVGTDSLAGRFWCGYAANARADRDATRTFTARRRDLDLIRVVVSKFPFRTITRRRRRLELPQILRYYLQHRH